MMRSIAAAACLCVISCSWAQSDADVPITLPAAPSCWQAAFGDICFRVVTVDSAGTVRSVGVPAGQGTVVVTCSRAASTPILAYPITSHDTGEAVPGLLRPAGALVASEESATLTWEEGPIASVILKVATAGRDVSLFNAERLAGYLAEKDDPWTVDLDAVAQRIAEGNFSAYDIDTLPSRDVTVSPGVGTWFLESPFAAVVESDAAGAVTLAGVTVGEHALFSTSGRLVRLSVGAQEVTMKGAPLIKHVAMPY